MRNLITWARRRPRMTLVLTLVVLFLLLNVVAYRFAYLLTHFATDAGPAMQHSYWQRIADLIQGKRLPRHPEWTRPEFGGSTV